MKKGRFKTQQDTNAFLDSPDKFFATILLKCNEDNRLADELAQQAADIHEAIKVLDLAKDAKSQKMRADAVRRLEDIGRKFDELRDHHTVYVRTIRNVFESNWIETRNPIFVWLALAFDESRPMPKWCRDYIKHCSIEIRRLAHNAALDPGAFAKTKLASALGFTRLGWNAFNNYRVWAENISLLTEYKSLQEEGLSTRSASEKILSHYGIEDERSLRRRLAAVKKASGHNRPS